MANHIIKKHGEGYLRMYAEAWCGERISRYMNAAWKEAHRRARVPYRIPHTCRHTRAAELLSTGVEPAEAIEATRLEVGNGNR